MRWRHVWSCHLCANVTIGSPLLLLSSFVRIPVWSRNVYRSAMKWWTVAIHLQVAKFYPSCYSFIYTPLGSSGCWRGEGGRAAGFGGRWGRYATGPEQGGLFRRSGTKSRVAVYIVGAAVMRGLLTERVSAWTCIHIPKWVIVLTSSI